ncbi:hypothetical protein CRYUN_Cryun41cG0062200 [Craigia yunnanensis]
MRKKLDTRFPAARIKKIMQADEDIGKIALAVPVLVSKALELFLQDLCDRTYEITLQRGAKTMNSLHLKHCVQSYNVFDFLRDIVSRVPDYGHGHSDAAADDRTISRRRKAAGDEVNESDEESKRSRMHDVGHAGTSGRGRGRGRGKGRGRGARNVERDSHHEIEPEPSSTLQQSNKSLSTPGMMIDDGSESKELMKENTIGEDANQAVRNFDLNAEVDEKVDTKASAVAATAAESAATAAVAAAEPTTETKNEEYPGWSLSDMDKMAIDPLQLAQLGRRLDEDEEDYDEEG